MESLWLVLGTIKNMKEGSIFHTIFTFIKESLFPLFCISCKKEGKILCDICFEKELERLSLQKEEVPGSPLSSLSYLTFYHPDSVVGKLLHEWKYNFIEEAGKRFTDFIHILLQKDKDMKDSIDFIVAVPLHKKRLAERGFNQSDVLVSAVCLVFQKEISHPLLRKKRTRQQAALSFEEREKNMSEAFLWNEKTKKEGVYLLVDDVFTTGSTMNECAKVLLENGATTVHGFVLARAGK